MLIDRNLLDLPQVDKTLYDYVDNIGVEYKVNQQHNPPLDIVHYHECYEIVLYVQAGITAYVGGQCLSLQTHDLLIIAPWQIHKITYNNAETYSRFVMYLSPDCATRVFSILKEPGNYDLLARSQGLKVSLTLQEYSRLNGLLRNMTYHKTQHSGIRAELLETYSTLILCELHYILNEHSIQEVEHGQHKRSIVEKALEYLNVHYNECISLEDLEKKLYLNSCYISRIFSQTMGMSLIQYLQFKRVLEAQRMLSDTSKPILEICYSCGFNNMQHFYRTFKCITTVTPKQFRDSAKCLSTTRVSAPCFFFASSNTGVKEKFGCVLPLKEESCRSNACKFFDRT